MICFFCVFAVSFFCIFSHFIGATTQSQWIQLNIYYSVYGHFFFITIDRSFDESNFESEIEPIYRTAYLNQSHSTENERVDRFGFFFGDFKETHAYIYSVPLPYASKFRIIFVYKASIVIIIASYGWKLCQPELYFLLHLQTHSIRGDFSVGCWPLAVFIFSFRLGVIKTKN